jgi:hypothetical protein
VAAARTALAVLSAALLLSCEKAKPEPSPPPLPAPTTTRPAAGSSGAGSLAVAKPAPERVVAIGDLHGDLDAARRALRLGGAIDGSDAWIGGKLVVVQTGDAIDRGDDDRKILDLLEKLKLEAPKSGGEVVALLGNHEVMNGQLDFRYVTGGAFTAFSDVNPRDESVVAQQRALDANQRGRASAFLPGGPYAKMLSTRPVVARVGDAIFVHGGVLPKYVKALDKINEGAKSWFSGESRTLPKEMSAEDGPLWSRMYSTAPGREECALLDEALGALHAKRMVMGHTVQKPDISPACNEHAWRIDVGMSRFYGGPIEVLELTGDTARVLKEGPR